MSPLRRLAIVACWFAIVGANVAAIVPQREAPHLGASDKVDHMVAFFTICFLARLAYRRVPVLRILGLAALFGAAIEISQMIPFIHRDAEFADWIADMVASILGTLATWPILAWWRRWEEERA